MSRRCWLMKSEPEEFSIDTLKKVGVEPWSGVRNYQGAQLHARWHAGRRRRAVLPPNCDEPGVVGIAEVASEAYPRSDPVRRAQRLPRSEKHARRPALAAVDVRFRRKLARTITPPS